MSHNVYLYILVMAAVTYLIRMLPLALAKNEIKSPFINSFLYTDARIYRNIIYDWICVSGNYNSLG